MKKEEVTTVEPYIKKILDLYKVYNPDFMFQDMAKEIGYSKDSFAGVMSGKRRIPVRRYEAIKKYAEKALQEMPKKVAELLK